MKINDIIIYIMLAFLVFAAIDKYFIKGKLGYGKTFDEAFNAMGPLALSIVGIMCFAPVLGNALTPLLKPLYELIGADPAMAAGSLFASDMGGYALAVQMTENADIRGLSGILLGSMMGVTVIFIIPFTSSVIEEADKPFLYRGILAGIIPVPIGCIIGGLIAGIGIKVILINLVFVSVFALILAVFLIFAPKLITKIFAGFSFGLNILIGVALVIAAADALTGYSIGSLYDSATIIPNMAPIEEQFITVGLIVIMLAGAYPFIQFLTTVLTKPLSALGRLIGVNDVTVAGMLTCLASSIPMYSMVKNMNERGKVIAISFSVCAGFALGDFLGFTSANMPEFIFPMIVGKISAGAIAAIIGAQLTPRNAIRSA